MNASAVPSRYSPSLVGNYNLFAKNVVRKFDIPYISVTIVRNEHNHRCPVLPVSRCPSEKTPSYGRCIAGQQVFFSAKAGNRKGPASLPCSKGPSGSQRPGSSDRKQKKDRLYQLVQPERIAQGEHKAEWIALRRKGNYLSFLNGW